MKLSVLLALVGGVLVLTGSVLLMPQQAPRADVMVVHVVLGNPPADTDKSAPSDFIMPDLPGGMDWLAPQTPWRHDPLDRIPWLTTKDRQAVRAGEIYFV